jgi:hypothetical protein
MTRLGLMTVSSLRSDARGPAETLTFYPERTGRRARPGQARQRAGGLALGQARSGRVPHRAHELGRPEPGRALDAVVLKPMQQRRVIE